MKFRLLVVILLGAIAYGVLYHDLPCWAQVLDPTMYCQMKAEAEQDQLRFAQWRKTHPHGNQFQWFSEQVRPAR